jgi:hypothetical protein
MEDGMKDKMEIDETEANLLYSAVRERIRTSKWNVDDEEDWQLLLAFKALEARIGKFMNGEDV